MPAKTALLIAADDDIRKQLNDILRPPE